MGSSVEELAAEAGVPVENFHPIGDGEHMEIIDTSTMKVWQTMAEVSFADFEALKVEAPYRKLGLGALAAYCSYFRRSPGADVDGPMETLEYGGHHWSHCARPAATPEFPAGENGPRRVLVEKHHSIVFDAGSDVAYLVDAEGVHYVRVIGGGARRKKLVVPEGWQFRSFHAEKQYTVHLPCPTTAFFWSAFESYQGPVPSPD